METLKLDGGEGQTYGGGATSSRDILSHAAWTHDFLSGPATKERISSPELRSLRTDNLLGLAVLSRDPAIGQCVSYYKLTVDFRQDQGILTP